MPHQFRFLLLMLGTAALQAQQQPRVVTTGLLGPQRLLLTPQGNLLVTEGGDKPHQGRVSLVTRGGSRRSLIEGLPSSVFEGESSGPTGMALRGRTLYLAIGAGDAEAAGPRPGTAIFNPRGTSSPIFSSILEVQLSADIDTLGGVFRLLPEHQQALADGDEVRLDGGGGAAARVTLLANFADGVPDANTIYRFSNPWGLELSADGGSLWVADASSNTVLQVDARTGRVRKAAGLAPLRNPTPVGPPVIDAVPTAIHACGGELLVSQLTGFPFLEFAARIQSLQADRTLTPFIANLSVVTDFACSGSGHLLVVEFSANMLAQPRPAPGRLLRFTSPQPTVVSNAVIAPVSVVYDEAAKTAYVLELTGRLLEFNIN